MPKLNVYLSGTSLPEHRAAVVKVLKALTLQPRGQEDDPADVRKQNILDSQIFIGIYGRYLGSQPPDQAGKSLTEQEYDWAGEATFNGQPIPRLAFLMTESYESPETPSTGKVELGDFKDRVKGRYFTSADDLAVQVTAALELALKTTILNGYEQALVRNMGKDDKAGQAQALYSIASLHDILGDKEKSIEYYRQAHVLYVKLKDADGQAITLNNIGAIYLTLGEKGKALGCFQQALPLYIESKNKSGQAATLTSVGRVHQALGESDKALDYFKQAHSLYIELEDKSGQAAALNSSGGVYSAQGEQDKALDYAQQAKALYVEVGDKDGQAAALNSIGLAYSRSGDKTKALDIYQQALALRIEVGDAHGEAVTRSNIATILWDQNRHEEAAQYMKQAHDLASGLGSGPEIEDDYVQFSTANGVESNN